MLTTHADDPLWASEPEYDHLIDFYKQHSLLSRKEEISFRFTSKEFVADLENVNKEEEELLDEWEIREPFRSQGRRLILLSNRDVIEGTRTHCHVVSFFIECRETRLPFHDTS